MTGGFIIKKFINVLLIFSILFINILVPATEVSANQNSITDDEAYAIGALVNSTQGGEVDTSPSFYNRMNDLGNNIIDTALSNGKRLTDIIIRNGNQLLINPSSFADIFADVWTEFANNEITIQGSNRYVVYTGANFRMAPMQIQQYENMDLGVLVPDITRYNYVTIHGTNLDSPGVTARLGTRQFNHRFTQEDYFDGQWYVREPYNGSYTGLEILRSQGSINLRYAASSSYTDIISLTRVVFSVNRTLAYSARMVPYNSGELPTKQQIDSNFSSTFNEAYNPETNQYNPTMYYSYDLSEINNASTLINNSYVTNNYTEITNIINEGDTIIYEPDESGGGTFWTALLNLLGTIASSISSLGSSIAGAISSALSNLFGPLFDFLTNIFDWLTWFEPDYMSTQFDTIQTGFSDKFPDFSTVLDTRQSVSNEPPDMTVNFSFMGIGRQTVMDISPYSSYLPYLKNILRAFMYLLTTVMVFVKITGGGLND